MTTLAYASPAHKPSSALECTVGIPSKKKKEHQKKKLTVKLFTNHTIYVWEQKNNG